MSPRRLLTYALPAQTIYTLVALWPLAGGAGPWFLAVNVIVACAFFATGAFLLADPEHQATGWAVIVAGLMWPLNWVNEWHAGPLPLIAALEGPLAALLVVWALLRYPVRWSWPWADRLVAAALSLGQVAALAVVVLSVPAWHGLPDSTPWLTIYPDRTLCDTVTTYVYDDGGSLVAVAAIVGFWLRFRRLHGLDRRYTRPLVAAVALAATVTALAEGGQSLGLGGDALLHAYLVENVCLIAIPLAFLTAAARRFLAMNGDVPRLIERLRRATSAAELQEALRIGLHDPGLLVAYRVDSPEQGPSYVDPDGRPVSVDSAQAQTLSVDGQPIGAVLTSSAVWRNRLVIEPVVRAVELVAQNTRLQPQVLAMIDATSRSADRLDTAIGAEIQHIVDEVGQGPIRRLATAASLLDDLAVRAPDLRPALARLGADARAAATALAALAADRPPTVLTAHGLGAAFAEFDHPALTVRVEDRRYPPEIETTAWFAVSELVTNAQKHAPQASLTVEQRAEYGFLHLVVVDDGQGADTRGGPDPAGTGLRGLAARASRIGGSLTVVAQPSGGTRASLRVPLVDQVSLSSRR